MARTSALLRIVPAAHLGVYTKGFDPLETGKFETVANRIRSLQRFFRWAVDEGEIERDPTARLRPPAMPVPPAPVLRDDELKRILAACAGQGFERAILVARIRRRSASRAQRSFGCYGGAGRTFEAGRSASLEYLAKTS